MSNYQYIGFIIYSLEPLKLIKITSSYKKYSTKAFLCARFNFLLLTKCKQQLEKLNNRAIFKTNYSGILHEEEYIPAHILKHIVVYITVILSVTLKLDFISYFQSNIFVFILVYSNSLLGKNDSLQCIFGDTFSYSLFFLPTFTGDTFYVFYVFFIL